MTLSSLSPMTSSTLTHSMLIPPLLRSYSSFESFHSLAGDSDTPENPTLLTEEGVRHAEITLNAKWYKDPLFAIDLARVLTSLRIPSWQVLDIVSPDQLRISKVSGSLTNAVFFISHPNVRTLLLRIYGPSSDSLISRPRELHTLHVLSSRYQFGPRVHGTFQNGRVEEFFESNALTAQEMREPQMSQYIAMRMAELHRVDVSAIEEPGWDVGIRKNLRTWIGAARKVLALADVETRKAFDIVGFISAWETYWNWVRNWEKEYGESPRVFAHNDAQYGNLLRLTNPSRSRPSHQQIIVVDFEYASPNPAAFDIANHFHEWTANYHSSTPWLLQSSLYPTDAERRNFYLAYIKATQSNTQPILEEQLILLEHQVRAWSPASHAMWAVWGLVQAREELETREPGEFDYLKYALNRVAGFRREIASLKLS